MEHVLNTIICGECVEQLSKLADNSIDMVLTSPPYGNMRHYGKKNLTNNEEFYDFNRLIGELKRVMKPGSVIIWVEGDQTHLGSESGQSFRHAIGALNAGLLLYDTMIFRKKNPLVQTRRRFEQEFEYIFCFAKGNPRIFNPILIPTKLAGKNLDWGNRKVVFDKNQCRRNRGRKLIRTKATKIHGNVFEYAVGKSKSGHAAAFPLQLAIDQIQAWTDKGDTVLDCFIGGGTTAVAAIMLDRNYIGIEIEPSNVELCKMYIQKEMKGNTSEVKQL